MTHKDLIKSAFSWVKKNGSCGVIFRELVSIAGEIPDIIAFGGWNHSVLIECKASRSDFQADKKKPFRQVGGMGKYRFYCVPSGLIKKHEVPTGWGLIYVDEKGKAVAIINPIREDRKSEKDESDWAFKVDQLAERAIMYTALRRLFIRGHVESIYKTPNNESVLEQ
jgi:hypothetical protein